MGVNTVGKHSADPTKFYASGARQKGGKISAAQMREALFGKHPFRHNIPIEHHITKFISKMGSLTSERLNHATNSEGGSEHIRRRVISGNYNDALKYVVDGDPTVKPREARDRMPQKLQLECNQLPPEKP